MSKTHKIVASVATALLSFGALGMVAGPAANAAIDSRCSITPLAPYKTGSSFYYGGGVNCSEKVATTNISQGQRQGTGKWTTVASIALGNSNVSSIFVREKAALSSGTHTYRSSVTGISNKGGQTTRTVAGVGITK